MCVSEHWGDENNLRMENFTVWTDEHTQTEKQHTYNHEHINYNLTHTHTTDTCRCTLISKAASLLGSFYSWSVCLVLNWTDHSGGAAGCVACTQTGRICAFT